MNFEGAKENIQPLAAGRNVEQLEVALNAESQHECQEELLQQRRQFDLAILNYVGDDPLELWFEYIGWVEQSYPKSGKESALDDLLAKCVSKFEKDPRYSQDPRFIRVFIKYIDTKKTPHKHYTKMYNNGLGTMVADLYIAWAHYFDVLDDFEQAKAVYQKGLDARAAPIEHLKQVYERFQFSVGQRVIRKEEYRQEFLSTMEAQRNAFTSLHSLKRSKVGSVRTGSAVKSVMPGRVRQDQSLSKSSSSNAPIKVYEGTSQSTSQLPPQPYRSVVEEIENSMIENHIEPGPWSKPSSRKSVFQGTHGNSTFKFKILEDDIEQPPVKCGPLPPDSGNLAINLPKNFVRKNDPQTPFVVPAYVEDFVELRTIPAYQKFYLHPNANVCFQSEELRWYKRLKDRGIDNRFTQSRDKVWGIGSTVPARVLANFPRQNQPQTNMETERPDISSIPSGQVYVCNLNALHPKDSQHELQFEEIMWLKYQRNRNDDAGKIDETVCVRGRQSFGVQYSRKSIAGGGRKSIMPVNATMEEFGTRRLPPTADDSGSDMDLTEDFGNGIDVRKEKAPAGALIHKVDEFLKPQAPAEVVLFKKPAELPQTTQWSVFNDEEPVRMTDEKNSGSRFNTTDKSKETKQNKETFTVPQIPLARTAEKRTTDSGPTMHADIPSTGRSQYPIGPQTGAVRKSIIRRSTISEHAVESSTNSNDTGAKLPDLDYSLCTQAFNVNLAEQMASTPVPIRRTEALTEQLRSQEIQPPKKLSIIMETTEGSASAASTKSSTQFSSPEDNDLSKSKSNVTNRTKLVGAATFTDDEATGACENNSVSERMTTALNGTNHGAGVTNYSCNVEKTLPAIRLSILPDAAPVEQNKREITTSAAAKDEPAKNYPFPIFEDAETLTAIAPSMSSNGEPREPNGLAVRSSRSGEGQFNETSMWIKDEPKSFTLNDMSAVEESFVLPIVSPGDMSAPLVRTTASGTSAAEESFAHPKGQRKSIAPPRLEANQTDSSAAEESFALPNGNGNSTHHIQFKDEPEPDVSTADESFALPNRQRKSIAPATFANETDDKSDGFQTNESKVDPQMDNSASEVALPNETFSNKSDQTEEDAEMAIANGTFDVSSDSEEEVIEVLDETSVEDAPKIVNVQSLAKNRFETSIRISISFTDEEMGAYLNKKVAGAEAANCSIYHNSVLVEPSWIEDEAKVVDRTAYQEPGVNLEESKIIINTKLAKEFLDPFSEALKGAFLDEHQFIESLKENSSCELISTVPTLAVKRSILFKGTQFDVLKCIGHGAYGRVYHVKESKDGTTYAVKKEMPANLWELYILSALHSRVVDKLSGYMKVDMSIIANDGSLLFSQYSLYGTLLDVCNRVFSSGNSNINESIVFILAYQMLDIVDRLHKADILHLDLKPDNFLVMKRMSTNHEDLFIQIIDFGNAVDLRLYPKGQQFKAALETKHFVCLEMLEGRPWKFQPDLYCLAATIHSVLFGRYLDVKKVGDNYQANVKIPRYFNAIWGSFFNKLINIPEGTSPNLQELKECFEQVIVEDKNLQMKIAKFNQFIV